MRLIEIRNNLLAIGEAISDRETDLIALEGLPRDWHVFNTTILNNNVIPDFDEIDKMHSRGNKNDGVCL